jgi:hypothetical protein
LDQQSILELFMILFDSPFKIKINFFANTKVANTLFDYLFRYLEDLISQAKTPA